MIEKVNGIDYQKPRVVLLQDTGVGVAEIAARTCYNSFESSENECVKGLHQALNKEYQKELNSLIEDINDIEDSELLTNLAWVHHHHSIIEHANLSFLILGTSRGVLQEHARHRLQSISVRSTRYTMSSLINAYVASQSIINPLTGKEFFVEKVLSMDMFVTADKEYNRLEIESIYNKLSFQMREVGERTFYEMAVAKSSLKMVVDNGRDSDTIFKNQWDLFQALEEGKKKRNVGDGFKHIVSDNWKVDMVVTFNIRSLKNYFDLRDSGAAWFQIQWLAQAMKEVTPKKYLKLIDKKYKNSLTG